MVSAHHTNSSAGCTKQHEQNETFPLKKVLPTRKQSETAGTSAKAMLFVRWRHRIRFASGFAYAPFNAMVTKISK